MNCEKCKDRDKCVFYQQWLNTRDCCCPLKLTKNDDLGDPSSIGYKTFIGEMPSCCDDRASMKR